LNEKALVNDSKTMNEYAKERLAAKIDSLKKRYLEEAHVNLNEVILVGHSMGGLVAGEYAVNCASDVKVKAIIALQTPWQGGSCLANLVYSPSNKPGGAFTSNNQMTKTLRAQVLKKHEDGDLQLYTFSSTFDPFVRPSSSALPIPQENQMISKVHGHYSPMMDPWLARSIQDRWIVPLSSADLPTYSSSGSSSNIARAFCESSQPRAAASS
jgi:pimeloyl-ACP methyl ester carboxylesterase